MDNAVAVRSTEPAGDAFDVAEGFVNIEGAAAQTVFEVFAARELHHDVVEVAVGIDVVDLDDVFVFELGGEAGLAQEAFDVAFVGGPAFIENLERDLFAQAELVGEVHGAHAAGAKQFLDLATADSLPDESKCRVIRWHEVPGAGVPG